MSNIVDAVAEGTCYTVSMKDCTESLVGHTDLQGFCYATKEVLMIAKETKTALCLPRLSELK